MRRSAAGSVHLGLEMIKDHELWPWAENVSRLNLWVLDGNDGAWVAYLKMGFDPTDEPSHRLESRRGPLDERRMTKALY
jgi:hypothetical protein